MNSSTYFFPSVMHVSTCIEILHRINIRARGDVIIFFTPFNANAKKLHHSVGQILFCYHFLYTYRFLFKLIRSPDVLFMNFFVRIIIYINIFIFIENIDWIRKKLFLIRMMKCSIFT